MSGKMWYRRPAEQWVEALPLGNGRLGAMVFGGTEKERIALNEDTLWSGSPKQESRPEAFASFEKARELVKQSKMQEAEIELEHNFLSDYSQAYMPLGDLNLTFGHDEIKLDSYRRSLDLARAVCDVEYETPEGVKFTREVFVSAPDQALIVNIKASQKGALHFKAELATQLKGSVRSEGKGILLIGRCPMNTNLEYLPDDQLLDDESKKKQGIRFCAFLNAITDGRTRVENGALIVENAEKATLVLTARNNFAGWNNPPELSGIPYLENAIADWQKFSSQGALDRHVQEHAEWWNRCGIQLDGESRDDLPTDERLVAYNGSDLGLLQLLFDYGRYLLIASSRPGTQATNLQGIWNESITPPWNSNYTTNINTEMNYWPALSVNLAEMQDPLDSFVAELCQAGQATAREYYHARGFVCHHNTDLWRMTVAPGRDNHGMVHCAFWAMASGWLSTHLYEKWKFTQDEQYLKQIYPILKEASRFYLDNLKADGKGHRIMGPSTSPENAYKLDGGVYGIAETTTMTTAIMRELFTDCLELSDHFTGEETFRDELKAAIRDLPPYQLDREGRIMEWSEDYDEYEVTHRHVSHLFGLYPARQITPQGTPELAEACRKSLVKRTDASTGWSMGWKVCLWARLGDGDHALKLLDTQLTPVGQKYTQKKFTGGGTYPNMMDAHPPFQIDGNFGACAGIAEMFVQSRKDEILILPALPKRWANGSAHGLRAYNGLEFDLEWADGQLESLKVKAHCDVKTTLLLPDGEKLPLCLKAGESYNK